MKSREETNTKNEKEMILQIMKMKVNQVSFYYLIYPYDPSPYYT